ncbi:MAG: VanZ family protein [Bacillota bacterium]|nr:VanZ family protein [Bacillota bacterium]
MLSEFIDPIYTAIVVFPILALVFTLPYLFYQYRRYGSVVIFRAVVVYSFILYLLCAYFLVILPLPSFEEAASGTGSLWQLTPLECVRNVLNMEGFSPRDLSTYRLLLYNDDFQHAVLNFIMFIPLGIYLHYYFRRGFFITLLIGFALTCFFEFTQISALYGIYPRPYRFFDVDDIIFNTLGAVAGFIISPLFTWIFPKRERLDEISYNRGRRLSPFRRLLAALADCLLIALVILLLSGIFKGMEIGEFSPGNILLYIVVVGLYFIGFSVVWRGFTPGKRLLRMQVVSENGNMPSLKAYAIRYGILYYIWLPSLYVAVKLNEISYEVHYSWAVTILVGIFALIFFVFLFQALTTLFKDDRIMLHERISHTRTSNLIKPEIE